MTALEEISALDAHAQAALVRSGEVLPLALLDAAIARIETINPLVNAVCHSAFDHARDAIATIDTIVGKAAPMAAVPYLLKASMEYPGFPHVSGSRIKTGVLGKHKYPFARRLDEAGLIPCGIATMPEFGLIGTGEALAYGPTRNPWNLDHSSGGSSSGSAVAVATGMVPFATGSDGGGSIRIPASHCGIIGFKPSRTWNLRARGVALMDDLLASDGLMGRSMRDTIWAAHHLRSQPAGMIGLDRPLRIALCHHGLDGLSPDDDIASMVGEAGKMCEALGHHVTPCDVPLNMPALSRAFDILWSYGAGEVVDIYHAKMGAAADAQLEPWTLGLARRREGITPDELANAFATVGQINMMLESFWQHYDVVLSPVASSTAPPLGVLAPDRDFEALWADHFRHVNYTQLQNMAGYPGISLPLMNAANGMPAGAMFWGKYGSDDLLLSLGAQLETAYPWAERKPTLPTA